MPKRALIDASVLVGLLSEKDAAHHLCRAMFDQVDAAVTCWPVVVEAAHLLKRARHGQEKLFDLLRDPRDIAVLDIRQAELSTIFAWMKRYGVNRAVDFADAVLVHLAHREAIRAVATLDEDFTYYRTAGGKPLLRMSS